MLFRSATVVSAARSANALMPSKAVEMLSNQLDGLDGKSVAVLGISYRGGVKEAAFSGVFPTVSSLLSKGAKVFVHDPMYSDDEIIKYGFTPFKIGNQIDAIVIQADHKEYRELSQADFPGLQAVTDGRRILNPNKFADINFRVIGAPASAK